MTRRARLSKSRFIRGIQCTKLLWWSVHEPGARELIADSSLQGVFDRGHQVGALARDRFPRGVFVEGDNRDQDGKVERTRRAIADGPPAIFEASFLVNDVFVAVDVLERRRGGWSCAPLDST